MKKNITYEQLLNLSIEEFNNRNEKTINEILLYLYHNQHKYHGFNYQLTLREIYKICINIDLIIAPIINALTEIIFTTKYTSIDYLATFLKLCNCMDTPIKYFGNLEKSIEAYSNLVMFFLYVLEDLDKWGYDLSRLMPSDETVTQE